MEVPDAVDAKRAARRATRDALRDLDSPAALAAGGAAALLLAARSEFQGAELVLAFLAMPREIDTAPLIAIALAMGKPCGVPRIEGGAAANAAAAPPCGAPPGVATAPLATATVPHGGAPSAELAFVPLDRPDPGWPRDAWGIPAPPAELRAWTLDELGKRRVLVVTPGLAFDRTGRRLGRGKGYYDRFLRALRAASASGCGSLVTAGFCLERQVLEEVPAGEGDEVVDLVVTEEGARAAVR